MRASSIPARQDGGNRWFQAAIHFTFIFYSLLCVIPVWLVVSVSLSSSESIVKAGYSMIPEDFSWLAYDYLLRDMSELLRAYGVTITVTATGTVLSLLVMTAYAFTISRQDFAYRNFFSFYIFFPMLFNGGIVPFYIIYTQYLGLKNSLWALILPGLVNSFYLLIMRTFFQTTIPSALIESAKIDGAGEFRILFRIIVPLSLPILATVGLFSTLGYWNEWFMSLIFIDDQSKVSIQYLMYRTILNLQYLLQHSSSMSGSAATFDLPTESIRMAMCVVGMAPMILVYPFFQKYYVRGLTIGAVKG